MSAYPSPLRRTFILAATSLSAIAALLQTSMLNIALPNMQAELGATADEISWSITSFLVATAIMTPMCGFLSDRLGARRLTVVCMIGFGITSLTCGLATSLDTFIGLRLLQGLFGGPIMPLTQLILIDNNPPEDRPRALAAWTMSTTVTPIFGPSLGAWLTEHLSWRWCFFFSIPIAVLAILITLRSLPPSLRRPRSFDWLGFIAMACAVGALQFVCDRGNRADWFEANEIRVATVVGLAGAAAFFAASLRSGTKPLFNLRVFRDSRFFAANVVGTIMAAGLFGSIVLQPLLLVSLYNYPPTTAGNVMMLRGLVTAVAMAAVPALMRVVPVWTLVALGMGITAAGLMGLAWLPLDTDTFWFLVPTCVHGIGVGVAFLPITVTAFAGIRAEDRPDASSLFGLTRAVGQSIGVSLNILLLTRMTQVSWNELGAHVQAANPALEHYAGGMGLAATDPRTIATVAAEINRQAGMIAMTDAFLAMAWFLLLAMPLALLLRERTRTLGAPAGA
ncbi:MAG: DHA2 family efflux MFS transporter permease subunit [Gammaproteobacteria bacterium]